MAILNLKRRRNLVQSQADLINALRNMVLERDKRIRELEKEVNDLEREVRVGRDLLTIGGIVRSIQNEDGQSNN